MTTRPRVLFVTYEASRTGSPLLLLRLLRWLREAGAFDLEVVCWRGGPLTGDFAAMADTRVVSPLGRRTRVEMVAVGAKELGMGALARRVEAMRVAVALRGLAAPDLVYLNGVPSFTALPHLGVREDLPVLGHVHELEFALGRSLPPGEEALLGRPDRYLAVSGAVADTLAATHGIDPDSITVCRGFVDDEPRAATETPEHLRARLGIPTSSPVVGAMGDLIWRKGPDLFVQLAAAIARAEPPDAARAHFVWVGGNRGDGGWEEVRHDLDAMGLGERFHLVGNQRHPADWHALFDVFALTSREDPFPLVVLEAAQAGVPVVSFDQGGAPEVLVSPEDGAEPVGVVVAPLDVAAMAEEVIALLADRERADTLGRAGRRRVRAHHVTSVVAPQVLAVIEELL